MKKILCLSTGMSSGGAERQMAGLSVLLKEKGYEVEVAWFYKSDFFQSYLDVNNVPTKHLFTNSYLMQIIRVWREIKHFKPDVVIAYMEGAALIASIVRFFNNKFVLIASERNVTWERTFKRSVRFHFYKKADYIVPNSFTQTALLRSRYPNLTSKLITIPNYTDLSLFSPSGHEIAQVIKIIVVARVNRNKNTLNLINAAKKLRDDKDIPPFRVDWYGNPHSGEYYDECNNVIGGDESLFTIHEPQKNIASYYQSSDIFCLPSLSEGFPNSLSEAMCCGMPVVCSNVCDIPEIVRDTVDGFLFNPNSLDDMVIALKKMLLLPDNERIRMGQNSRRRAEELFDKQHFVEQYIKLIESK